jgi:S1-C subfamily serine protease
MRLTVKVGEQAEPREAEAKPNKVPATLGLTVEPLTPRLARELGLVDTQGLVVREVESESPADEAGIQAGDVIVEVNRHAVHTGADLRRQLVGHAKGTPVLILVHRGNGSLFVTVTT